MVGWDEGQLQVVQPSLVRSLDRRHHQISSSRIEISGRAQVASLECLRPPFALDRIDRVSPAGQHEVELAVLLVAPELGGRAVRDERLDLHIDVYL